MATDALDTKYAAARTALNDLDAELANTITAAGTPRGTSESHVERMAAANGPTTPSPNQGRPGPGRPSSAFGTASTPVVTASVAGADIAPGQVLTDPMQLAEVMSETLRRMQRDAHHFGRSHRCATARWTYPEDRQLDDSIAGNTAKLDKVCGLTSPRFGRKSGALVATGGICLPTNVDYSVPTWSTADRPLRDGLPAFQATRGGVQFVTPPDVGVPSLQATASGAGLATGVWTEATDASPAGATKPVWQVACGSPQQVYVNAIPTRVEFGNMQSRFAPEQVAANTEQAIATAAREAELELLTLMYGASKQVLPQKYLGATRDLLASVDLLIAQYRYSHRIPRTASFTAVFPDWARDVIRADMSRELAHDNNAARDVLGISDDLIDVWFSTRGIEVIWTLDGLKSGTYGTGGSALPNQFFPIATAGAEPQWPNQSSDGSFVVGWLLYVEGTFQFLDGGRLDLGVVRDSILDATNDYETFVEPFESIAFRGVEVYQCQSTVLPTGGSAGSIATTGYHE